jgi:hypothetical protein
MEYRIRVISITLIVIITGITGLFFYRTIRTEESILPEASFGGVSLRVEYAITETARERGLGGRTSIPSDYGMLFVFPNKDYYGFWMKNTLVPLDIFWLNDSTDSESISGEKGQLIVVSMSLNIATSTYPDVFYPSAPARYVLETAAGFAQAHLIATGTSLLLKNLPNVSK